jgi:hypothetical protein
MQTLHMLGPIALAPGLDLSPFAHLTELHGLLLDPASLAAPLQQAGPAPAPAPAPALACSPSPRGPTGHASLLLPASLSLLGLQAWEGPAPAFDAAAVSCLSSLRELRLGGFAVHDLRALPPTTTKVCITGPRTTHASRALLGPGCVLLPGWGAEGRCLPPGEAGGPKGSRLSGVGRLLARAGRCFGAGQAAGDCAVGGAQVGCADRSEARAVHPPPPHQHRQQLGCMAAGAAAGQHDPSQAQAPAQVQGLHLHLTSPLAPELAIDLSWALSQPALSGLTISGSQVHTGQVVRLRLSGGLGFPHAASRHLLQELARSPGEGCTTRGCSHLRKKRLGKALMVCFLVL